MKEKLIPNANVLRRIILIEWLILGIYAIIKIFGGNYFRLFTSNEHFINLCYFIDNHLFVKIVVACCTSYLLYYIYYNAILKQWVFNKFQLIIYLVAIPIEIILKILLPEKWYFSFMVDIITLIVVPFLLKQREINVKFIFEGVIGGIVLLIFFQFVSLFIKSVAIKVLDDNTLTSLIYSIDVYIMISLYYLYSNRKSTKEKTKE